MIALVVTIQIQPRNKDPFMEAMLDDARHSVQDEPGCLRFDVLQDKVDPNRIYLYEVYLNEAALEFHRRTSHYLRWKRVTQNWFVGESVLHLATPVFPAEDEWID